MAWINVTVWIPLKILSFSGTGISLSVRSGEIKVTVHVLWYKEKQQELLSKQLRLSAFVAMQKQTTVTSYLKSRQLLLFALEGQSVDLYRDMQVPAGLMMSGCEFQTSVKVWRSWKFRWNKGWYALDIISTSTNLSIRWSWPVFLLILYKLMHNIHFNHVNLHEYRTIHIKHPCFCEEI